MKKRQLLADVPKIEPPTEPEPIEKVKEIEESQVFNKPKKGKELEIKNLENMEEVIEEEPLKEPVKEPKKPYSHLAEARAKSLETRRKKAEERKAIDKAAHEYKEKLIYERLKAKYEKKIEKEKEKLEKKSKAKAGIHQEQPAPPPQVEEEPIIRPPSVVNDTVSTIDYDRIVNSLAEKMTPNQQYLKDLEDRIRKDERSKHDNEMKKWQHDQHRRQQREQSIGLMAPRYNSNPVFNRSNQIRQGYQNRYNPNWYNM